jgi:hypothetical protein
LSRPIFDMWPSGYKTEELLYNKIWWTFLENGLIFLKIIIKKYSHIAHIMIYSSSLLTMRAIKLVQAGWRGRKVLYLT